MKKLSALLFLLLSGMPLYAQRGYHFRHHAGFRPEERNLLTGSAALGGFGGIGFTLGIEYEHIFGERGRLSIIAPAYYSAGNDGFLSVADYGDYYHYYKTFFIAPGIRYHPAGAFHKADFSLGLQLAAGSADTRQEYIGRVTSEVTNFSTAFTAILGGINLSITSPDGFVFGIFMNGGPVLSGEYGKTTAGRANDGIGIFQAGIKIGGRF